MKQLIIAEKPSLAAAIVAGIGSMKRADGYYENAQYIVTFAFGHLLGLKSIDEYLQRGKAPWSLDELPFIPEKFEFVLKNDPGIKKQYGIICGLYRRSDVSGVINAGDPDREGSVIILNLVQKMVEDTGQTKPVLRVWLKATTPEFVRQALQELHPEEYYGNLYDEGLARTYIDWLYGMNYTRYLSLKIKTLFPVGRVLVPIVQFVYERDKAIHDFRPERYFTIEGRIQKDGKEIACQVKDLRFTVDEETKSREKLLQLQKEHAIVTDVNQKDVTKHPPKLFSLDTLQNKLSQESSLSPAETLSLVQKLYESGYVTYPRTNTEYLASAEQDSVRNLVNQLQTSEPVPLQMRTDNGIFDDNKIEGHTALIITQKIPGVNNLSAEEHLVYKTIRNRFLANFVAEKTILQKTIVTIRIGEEVIEIKGSIVRKPGFLQYEKEESDTLLPAFTVGEVIPITLELAAKTTTPPSSVTEAELMAWLKRPFKRQKIEDSGDDREYRDILAGCEIGTVATRAGILENALHYEYIKKNKKALKITSKGVKLIISLQQLKVNLSKEQTVQLGMRLKQIYQGGISKEAVVKEVANQVRSVFMETSDIKIDAIKPESFGRCPACGGDILQGKKIITAADIRTDVSLSFGKK